MTLNWQRIKHEFPDALREFLIWIGADLNRFDASSITFTSCPNLRSLYEFFDKRDIEIVVHPSAIDVCVLKWCTNEAMHSFKPNLVTLLPYGDDERRSMEMLLFTAGFYILQHKELPFYDPEDGVMLKFDGSRPEPIITDQPVAKFGYSAPPK